VPFTGFAYGSVNYISAVQGPDILDRSRQTDDRNALLPSSVSLGDIRKMK
jgi:hypothetical protein